jgi:hypothetical protein
MIGQLFVERATIASRCPVRVCSEARLVCRTFKNTTEHCVSKRRIQECGPRLLDQRVLAKQLECVAQLGIMMDAADLRIVKCFRLVMANAAAM